MDRLTQPGDYSSPVKETGALKPVGLDLKEARDKAHSILHKEAFLRSMALTGDQELTTSLVDVCRAYIDQAPTGFLIYELCSFLQKALNKFDDNDELSAEVFIKWLTKNIQYHGIGAHVLFLEPGAKANAIFIFWVIIQQSWMNWSASTIEILPTFTGADLEKIVLPKIVDSVKSVRVRITNPAKLTYLGEGLFPLKLTLSPNALLKKVVYIYEPDEWFELDARGIEVNHERFPLSMQLESCYKKTFILGMIEGLTLEVWSMSYDSQGRAKRDLALGSSGKLDYDGFVRNL